MSGNYALALGIALITKNYRSRECLDGSNFFAFRRRRGTSTLKESRRKMFKSKSQYMVLRNGRQKTYSTLLDQNNLKYPFEPET